MPKTAALPATSDAVALLTKALTDGHSITLSLAAAPRVIREPPLVTTCCLTFGMTPSQSRVLVALLEHGTVDKTDLHRAMSRDGRVVSTVKNVDVAIHKLRRKLAKEAIKIHTVWGQGYRLTEADRIKVREILDSAAAGTPTKISNAAP